MYACGLVIIGFMYHFYAPAASCSLNIFFITWTLIMGIAYSIFSVSVSWWKCLQKLVTEKITFALVECSLRPTQIVMHYWRA